MNEVAIKLKPKYSEKNPLLVYKFVTPDGRAPWGCGKWDLPKNGNPGETRSIGSRLPVPCYLGIHGFPSAYDLLCSPLRSQRLFVAALWGEVARDINKVAAQHGRLLYEVRWDSVVIERLRHLRKRHDWFHMTRLEKGIEINKVILSVQTASAGAYGRWLLSQGATK